MQHYFGTIADNHAIIDGRQIHHLIDVRRTAIGEKIEVSDGTEAFLCMVESVNPLSILVLQKLEQKRELDIDLTVAFGLLKGDHNDLIVLKGTELGVGKFIPFLSERVIVKPDGEDNRLLRLRKKAEEGAMQCRRDVIPEVTSYMNFEDVLSLPYDYRIFAYESMAGSEDLLSYAKRIEKRSRVLVVIGPEGGFTHEEARLALDYDFDFVGLGRRILRAETAAIYCASILGAYSEVI